MRGRVPAVSSALAFALWGTSVHLVPREGGLFRGLFDPPSLPRLVLSLVVALFLAKALEPLGRAARPFHALALCLLPAIPLAFGVAQAFLIFQGKVMALVGFASLGCALALFSEGSDTEAPRTPERSLILAALVFYALLGTRIPGPAGPQGDEPHHLLIAESLLHDHTLDLSPALKRKAYADFYPGTLEPHTSPRSPKGRIYSVHSPGLAILILPIYGLFGYPGARLLLSGIAALTGGLVYRLILEMTGRRGLALAAWGILTFLPPLPFYAVAIYPEVPAACATVMFLLAARGSRSPVFLTLCILSAAFLPWLHPKFLPLAVVGIGLMQPSLVRRVGGVLVILSTLGLLAFFSIVYGTPSFSAAYGPGLSRDLALAHIPWGLSGLFLDRQFGLLAVCPLFCLCVPGALAFRTAHRRDSLRAFLLGGVSVVIGAAYSMWWGGACPPGRFLIPALPTLVLPLALALPTHRRVAGTLAGLSFGILALAAELPRALHNRADAESGLLRVLAPGLNLSDRLPSFVRHDLIAVVLGLSLLCVLALAWARGLKGFLAGAIGYLLVASGLSTSPWINQREATLNLLEVWDRTSIEGEGLEVPLDLPGAPWIFPPSTLSTSRRIDLPPGLYRAKLHGRTLEGSPQAHTTRLVLKADGLELLRFYLEAAGNPTEPLLSLPGGVRRLQVEASPAEGMGLVEGVSLIPLALVPRPDREGLRWPRQVGEDRYRVSHGLARVTALDGAKASSDGFTLEADQGRFLLEAPRGETFALTLSRPDPRERDVLEWGKRTLALTKEPRVSSLRLETSQGVPFGDTVLVPFSVRSYGASIGWSGSPFGTSATSPKEASPPPLPTVTTIPSPPDSGKK